MNSGCRKNIVSVLVFLSLPFVVTNGLLYARTLTTPKTTEQGNP